MLLVASILPAHAERIEVKGSGVTQFQGGTFSADKPTDKEREAVLALAKRAAWNNFVAKLSPPQQQIISQNEQAITDNMGKFLIDFVILDSIADKEQKTLNVVIRAGFNNEAVSQFLQKMTVNSSQQVQRSKDSVFTFLFTARKQTSLKQFDARRTDRVKAEAAKTKAADGGVSVDVEVTSGGSTQHKEDEVSWGVTSSQDLDAAMGEVISASGIEYVGYDDIVTSCNGIAPKKFQNEYVTADEISPATRSLIFRAARDCEVRYFATGTVDSGIADTDPVSGNKRVFVSVRAQLWDISTRLPRKIGSVGPKQYSGLGPDQSVAGRNALSGAARETAKTLVDQLNAKGIR
jgi:hypothetical protein